MRASGPAGWEGIELEYGKPIDIGSDVWVGGGAIILAGVTIGSRSVIGSGSVVTRDVPEGGARRRQSVSRDPGARRMNRRQTF
jgi:acetyltransferase-like isoleucine patch superfamily enzyme